MMISFLRLFLILATVLECGFASPTHPFGEMDALHVTHEALPWADFGNGIFLKFAVTDPVTGMYTVLLKSNGGGQVNRHRHFGQVYGITLKGAWYYKEHEWLAKEGDFVWETPGSVHTLMTSDDYDENLVFYIVFGALEFLDEEGKTIVNFDWKAAAATQYAACEEQGVECPDLTRPRSMVLPAAATEEKSTEL